jgi:hypothetical protein
VNVNPFDGVSDSDLQYMQLALNLACNRVKPALAHKRENWFCFLGQRLQIEANSRGLPIPVPPFATGALPRGPQAL